MKHYLINYNIKIKDFFSPSNYIIRLDDASHFSDLSKWIKITSILDDLKIKPIVAVIPDNKDSSLMYSTLNNNFWDLVRSWKDNNWSIAMHGYNHVFHRISRKKLMFPYYNRSEFGGLPIDSQKYKIKNSLKLFNKNGISPTVWVAPAHTFDFITLEALKEETEIKIISDGIAFHPYFSKDFYFIPQQIWDIKKRFFGTWTICLHPDTMSIKDIEEFSLKIKDLAEERKITNLNEIDLYKRPKSVFETFYSLFFWIKYELKYLLKK